MIAIIQNDPEVPPGTLIEALEKSRIPYRVVKLFSQDRLPAWKELSGAVVLGGIMSVNDTDSFPFLVGLKDWIREILRGRLPLLGICLGGQLLAEVGGGKVFFRTNEEFGCKPVTLTESGITDPLFRGVRSPFVTFHWHNDCFVPPPDAIHLARTGECAHQAFRWGPCAYGLQFHPEVTRDIVSHWSVLAEHRKQFIADFAASESTIQATSSLLFQNFFDLVSPVKS
jgi:GMP synthase (glutamine-hydrolysing)